MSRHRWLELIGRPELHDLWPMAKGVPETMLCWKEHMFGVPAGWTGAGVALGVGHGSSRDVPEFTPFYPVQSWHRYVLISHSTPVKNCWTTFRK